jgi:hypothetical protein
VEVLIAITRRLLVLAALLWGVVPAWAQQPQASEAAVKAAFLYRFAAYVEWRQEALGAPGAPFLIGVAGSEEVAAELEQLVKGRPINNRPVAVRRMKEGEGISGVHMLFVAGRDAARIRALSRAARPASTLLVSEAAGGLEAGSVINFVPMDDRVGFEVSIEAAERSGLKVSSRMLGVALRVLASNPP